MQHMQMYRLWAHSKKSNSVTINMLILFVTSVLCWLNIVSDVRPLCRAMSVQLTNAENYVKA